MSFPVVLPPLPTKGCRVALSNFQGPQALARASRGSDVLGVQTRPGASERSPFHLAGLLLPARTPLTPGAGDWGRKARRARPHRPARDLAQVPQRSQTEDRGGGGDGARKSQADSDRLLPES